ncbi:HprK-related kinase A [Kordiimonas sp.]|uniref:HprK-related kinase A n=1 Tax=Kordiimonas sp. TaxID=1970157 RepID=UPI003A945A3A
MTADKLATVGMAQARQALARGRLNLHLGPFVTALQSRGAVLFDYFQDMYRDCPVTIGSDALVDYSLRVGAPNVVRRYFRPQVVPDPGFHFPAMPLPSHMAPLALEMGMNLSAALQCFRFVIFHAGVVAKGDEAVLVAAHSGGGKSTLTAALMENGYRLLSDEFAVLRRSEPKLQPYPRPVSLKNASIDVVRELAGPGEISMRMDGTPKGAVAYRRARASDIEAMNKTATPRLLVFPRYVERSPAEVKKIEAGDAAMRLVAGSPNYQVTGRAGFESTMAMMDRLTSYEITYGNTEDSVRLVNELYSEASS